MMSFMPCSAALTKARTMSGLSLMIWSDAAMACAMCGKNSSVGITLMATPAASTGGIQSGTPAMPTDLPVATICQTPTGPADWISTSSLRQPALASRPSSA